MGQSYSESLKHPLWQRKRLEILQAKEFACEHCGSTDKTLHVHHGYYARGLKPWEYEDETLYVLCEDCHEREQALLDRIQRRLGELGGSLDCVLGFLDALAAQHPRHTFTIENAEYGWGVGLAYNLSEREVIDAATECGQEYRITDGQLTAVRLRKEGGPDAEQFAQRWEMYRPA